jgi:hypothetical protein
MFIGRLMRAAFLFLDVSISDPTIAQPLLPFYY